MVNGKPWTLEEDIQLIKLYQTGCTYKEISILLSRSVSSLYHRCHDLGLTKMRGPYAVERIQSWGVGKEMKKEGIVSEQWE